MATRKFLTSVADVYAYDSADNILFTGKTLLDSSIEVSLGSAPVRGGRGNQLQYIYYHTGEMKFTLTDTQWNLAMLAETVGADAELGEYYKEETIAMTSATGSVVDTPLAFEGGNTVYGWATNPNGETQRIVLNSGGGFTVSGSVAGNWCVRYYTKNTTSGNSITIPANMIPSVVKLVMETQLNSADVTTNKIGMVQIIAPTVALSGAFTISMTADGVANTPLTGTALAYTPASSADACESAPYYAKIVEIIDNTNWYDNIFDLSIYGGDISATIGDTGTLVVYAITDAGNTFKIPTEYMTYGSASPAKVSINSTTGSWTALTTGSALISACVVGHAELNDDITITVSA